MILVKQIIVLITSNYYSYSTNTHCWVYVLNCMKDNFDGTLKRRAVTRTNGSLLGMHWRMWLICGRCDGKCGKEKEKEKEGVLVRKEVKPTQYMYHSQDGKIPPNSAVG